MLISSDQHVPLQFGSEYLFCIIVPSTTSSLNPRQVLMFSLSFSSSLNVSVGASSVIRFIPSVVMLAKLFMLPGTSQCSRGFFFFGSSS